MAAKERQIPNKLIRTVEGRCEVLRFPVRTVADFIEVVSTVEQFTWYRGHAKAEWELVPGVFRYSDEGRQQRAVDLIGAFKRQAITKIPDPPARDEELEWLAIAQHHGLPTRLLDWTANPAAALFFACWEKPEHNGAVYMFQPADLNRQASAEVGPIRGGIYDAQVAADRELINRYAVGEGTYPSIAVDPAYNSERILVQKGAFTLHNNRRPITRQEAPSLTAIPVMAGDKATLLKELAVIGIEEMSLFPELEHTCRYLRNQV